MTELTNIVAAERRLDILHPANQEPVGLVLILLPDSQRPDEQRTRRLGRCLGAVRSDRKAVVP
ncbi:TPA: hypothetical protein ACGCEE_000062 [Stenotrophomonas maltophilia]|uniref:hypothetical protein n=1 Tax=Stenotrophomonas maltophilia TaxID=40324 RepID=UPI000DB8D322|nr:hypothetical protein [Stenotrophomonas maltophilia]MCI1157044.1 hypothetical protein [Stenotrophomonas maltophilia]PZS75059.1 hypothetical protein A7X68_03460 [Stenotrophomonas maltophilia]